MSNSSSIISLCLISILLMTGCDSSKKGQKRSSADTTYADSVAMKNDSLPPPPKPGPAPGHAKIHAKIADIAEESAKQNYATITFLITQVDAYGPSTPPLAVRDSVKVRANKTIIKGAEISLGKIVTAVISYRQFVLGDDTSPRWTLVTLD